MLNPNTGYQTDSKKDGIAGAGFEVDKCNPVSQLIQRKHQSKGRLFSSVKEKELIMSAQRIQELQVSRFSISTTPMIPDFGTKIKSRMDILFLLQLCPS